MVYLTERITLDPGICNGKPTIRGLRITVQTILEFLFAGDSPKEILDQFPVLTEEDIQACQQFAISIMGNQYILQSLDDQAA